VTPSRIPADHTCDGTLDGRAGREPCGGAPIAEPAQLLTNVGLPELIAASVDQYLDIASAPRIKIIRD